MTDSLFLPASFSAEVQHFALITFEVPSARVRALVPRAFELDGLGAKAFVSVGCFTNHGFHWALSRRPQLNFPQATYRTYVRYRGRPGVYFFATSLGTKSSFALQRSIIRAASPASFRLIRDPHSVALARSVGYGRYDASIRSQRGMTDFRLEAHERIVSEDELAFSNFLTYRLHGYFRSSAGVLADQRVSHRHLRPWKGQLLAGRFDLLERLGLVYRSETLSPVSVLVEPSVRFRFYLPFPVALLQAFPNVPAPDKAPSLARKAS